MHQSGRPSLHLTGSLLLLLQYNDLRQFNKSLRSGRPPSSWQRALVTPVPKVQQPKKYSDLRPIAVTPILSRLFERYIVRSYLMPSLLRESIRDQYAYRPTGSTTSALIALQHHVFSMLETVPYVRCLAIDFSKAFDTVNHPLLFTKLKTLNLPSPVFHWICHFLTDREQAVSSAGHVSAWLSITRSIVQGSGIGPSLYIAYADDLKPLSARNVILKYADDTYLLVPQDSSVSLEAELAHLKNWSVGNKLMFNLTKTKEIIFRRPRARIITLPPPLPDIARTDHIIILGVTVTNHFSVALHVDNVIATCNQRVFLIGKLKSQGLASCLLQQVFQALVIAKISYALSAIAGLLTSADKSRYDAFFKKAKRRCIIPHLYETDDLIIRADSALFRQVQYPYHCLHHLLPRVRPAIIDYPNRARSQGHNYCLPSVTYKIFRDSFIIRNLFDLM